MTGQDRLITGLPKRPRKTFTQCPFEDFANPRRVHVDPFGNVHLCQGISMGNMWETPFSTLVKDYDPHTHPICGPILAGGPARLAEARHLQPEDEYVDACHMCSNLCLGLIDQYPQYLAPRQVYGLK